MNDIPYVRQIDYQLQSVWLERSVEISVILPDSLPVKGRLNLLLFNDGQDFDKLQLMQTLSRLYSDQKINPVLVAGIKSASARLEEYGVAGVPDYMGRGASAENYTAFVKEELLPFLQEEFKGQIEGKHVFAGCSLGGLTAFDIVWNNPALFDAAGVFSGSFWWRKKGLADGYIEEEDRIMHEVVKKGVYREGLKFWMMTGTEDEHADRNHNYIIDAIDDTIDLIKELLKKGYRRPEDICYYEMVGGKHETASWAQVMPAFLIWAFGSGIMVGKPL